MLTEEFIIDLQERLALARLNDEEKISIDIKSLQLLVDSYVSKTAEISVDRNEEEEMLDSWYS